MSISSLWPEEEDPTPIHDAIKKVKVETPAQFRVGATHDILQKKGDLVVSYDRTWKNLWGVTAYAKAYWHDQAVIPADKFGGVIGVDVTKKF